MRSIIWKYSKRMGGRPLEHDPETWKPVFGEDHAPM
jgi:hypothetical protein